MSWVSWTVCALTDKSEVPSVRGILQNGQPVAELESYKTQGLGAQTDQYRSVQLRSVEIIFGREQPKTDIEVSDARIV